MTPAYESAALSAAAVVLFAIWLGVPPVVHWLRNGRRVMRHIQQLAQADRQHDTRPLDLGGVVIPLHDRHAPRCLWCWPKPGDPVPGPADCTCKHRDCGSVACLAELLNEGLPQ